MSEKRSSIASKSFWTMGTYAGSAGIRFSTNIVLSHLLGPAALGVVVVAQAVRAGAELLTDMGLEQNVVHSPHGDDEIFLNTVWTIQILRGLIVSVVCAALAQFIAKFYRVETGILLVMSAAPLLNSLTSTSIFTLSKRMNVKSRNVFELGSESIGLILNIVLAFTLRSYWAPIIGITLSLLARSALSYFLPHPRHRLALDRVHLSAIFHFSKWIMLSSLALYAAIYVDRLFLARLIDLAALGVYGLARAIADLPQVVAGRLAFQIVFPFVADNRDGLSSGARSELSRTRLYFLAPVALGVATVMAWSDWAVKILYGGRYSAAGWMLGLLLIGSWVGTLASLNEATVFGRGKPQNVGLANTIRVIVVAIVLPAGFSLAGMPGAVLALPVSECVRYLTLTFAQRRQGVSFFAQEAAMSLGLLALFCTWIAIRLALGLGVPWSLMH